MKKFLTLLLLFSVLLSLAGCGPKIRITFDDSQAETTAQTEDNNTASANCKHDWAAATYDNPMQCIHCGKTNGDPLISPTKWGFYYLEEMENCLIGVDSYHLSEENDSYVLADGQSMHFEYGQVYKRNLTVEQGKAKFGESGTARPYSLINNDSIFFVNEDKYCRINARKTEHNRNDFVCFSITGRFLEDLYVPYSLIDWTRDAEIIIYADGDQVYKFYLIN